MKAMKINSPLLMSGTKLFLLNEIVAQMHCLLSLTWIEKLSTKWTMNVCHVVHGVPLYSDRPVNLIKEWL